MIRATFTGGQLAAGSADPDGRTITGTAVPWDVVGIVSDGTRVVFHPGALDPTGRPVLLRDHDTARPLGRVVAAADTGVALDATARVARTRDGDEALVLAAPPDSVLGMFSVGADPTDFQYDADGTMHVYAADWHELSLLSIGAYAAAKVATVTASHHHPEGETMPDTLHQTVDELDELDPVDPVDPDPDQPDDDDPDDTRPTPVQATRGRGLARLPAPAVPLRAGGARRPAPLDLRGLAGLIAAGKRRGLQASAINSRIQAALTNVTTTDIAGMVRPAYRAEITGLVDHGMPLVRAITNRPLPASGMTVEYPVWTAPPDAYAIQAAEKTPIATGPVTVGVQSVDIDTWAQGNDISFQALNRSDPSFIDAYLRAAAVDAGRKYDTHVATALLAVATAATGVPGASFVENVANLFSTLNPATTPAGPMFLAVSYDQAVGLIGVTESEGPAFWDVSLNLGDFNPSVSTGGLLVFADWNLPPATMLLGSRAGASSYGGPDTSADVRVVDVSLLGIDIGVYFYAALAVEYPGAFAKLTGITTTAAAASTSKSSK